MSDIGPQLPVEGSETGPRVGDEAAVRAALPVETLPYSDGGGGAGTLRRVAMGTGLVAVVSGGLLVLSHGLQLVGWIGGWSDPYMFKINQPGGVGGLPPSQWLAVVSVGTLLFGVAWALGGAALMRRRRWGRWVLVCGGVLALLVELSAAGMWMIYNTLLPISRYGGVTFTTALFEVAPRVSWIGVAVAFPGVLIVMGLRREVWGQEIKT